MDQDSGGQEDLTDEGIAKFLEEAIGGELDPEFIDEFKSSDLFDDFLTQLHPFPGGGGTPQSSSSRRASLESEKEKFSVTFTTKNEEPAESHRNEVPSTSKEKDPKKTSYDDTQKKKRKSNEHSEKIVIPLDQSREKTDYKKPHKKKAESPEKLCSPAAASWPVIRDVYSQHKPERRESIPNSNPQITATPVVRLFDLSRMKNKFPNGLNEQSMPIIANRELLQAIIKFERELLSLEACRKLEQLKKQKRSVDKSGEKEKQKIIQLEDRSKNNAKVTSGSSSSSNAKKKIAAVLENVQSIENRTEKHQTSRCNESSEKAKHVSSQQTVMPEVPAEKKTKTSNVSPSSNNKVSNSPRPVSKGEMSTVIAPAPSPKQVHSSSQSKPVLVDYLEKKKKKKRFGIEGISQSDSPTKSSSERLDSPEKKKQRVEKEGSSHHPSSQEASKERKDPLQHSKNPALENLEKHDLENVKDCKRKPSKENADATVISIQTGSSVSLKLDLRIPPLELVKRKEVDGDPLPQKATLKVDCSPQVPELCVELTATESPAVGDKDISENLEGLQSSTDQRKADISSKTDVEAAEEGVPKQSSPGRKSVSPEKVSGRKSASPERIVYKRKNVIESSSDDDIKRTDTGDETDGGPERKKSSDEEQARKSLGFERKRDQTDPRSKKFDKFEHERQRKLGEKKKGKEKPKENIALDEVLKEKPLIGSFRIPKKATTGILRRPKAQLTPLATADVPKENLQIERSRKGTEKEKRDRDFSWGRQQDHTDGPKYGDRFKKEQESTEQSFRNRFTDKDDGRVVMLAPEEKKEEHLFSPPSKIEPPQDVDESEPQWANDGEELGEGATSSSSSEEDNIVVADTTNVKSADHISPPDVEEDSKDVEPDPLLDPEVPVEFPHENAVTVGAVYLIKDGDKIVLPDIEVLGSNDITVMRLAWWLSRMEPSSLVESDSDCDDKSDNDGASFLRKLEFTESDEEDLFPNDATDPRRKPHQGLVDEVCGRSLLSAQFRSGPGDKFSNIFDLRSGASYEKENFQAKCSLCACLVVGKKQLAEHVVGESHRAKMSTAGLGDEKGVFPPTPEKKSKEGKVKVECDKASESDDKKTSSSSKRKDSSRTETTERKEKKKDGDTRGREERVKRNRNPSSESEKRKRAKDDVSDEGTRKSKAEGNASGAKAERRCNRSRSRSPRHNRTRSRSPRRRSRSPRAQRRRSRSIQRIPRSPSKIQEAREQRRRSTSAERVQKFLAKTNRRSRSPPKGHSRKRRRSRSKSPTGLGMPRRDNLEFNQKLVLTAAGKWTDEMEQRWKLMEAEQAIFMEQYGEEKKQLNDAPESHSTYGVEWETFWQRRYGEVQGKGLDPDSYDYVPEWEEYWSKKLRDLLKDQYEKGIKEIKERHGMDLDSLHKILAHDPNKLVSSVVGGVEVVNPPSVSTPADQCTPSTPSSVPFSNPPPSVPQSAPSNPASMVQLPSSVSSKASGNGDDYTARPMSISDGGSGAPTAKSPNGVSSTPAITVGDIMSKWEKLKSGELPASPRLPLAQPVVRNFMSKSKNSESVSEADSGSIASFDFDGFELTQVLRHMTNLEDQLSFFADKVKEYFRKAEELDLKKKNKSLVLLDDEDFVVMLFNVRDRFMAMIRANILSKDILKSLNYTVYALNSILDAPQCKKHRSKVANSSASSALEKEINQGFPTTANSQARESTSVKSRNPLTNLSSGKKEKIAMLVTEFLQNMGKETLSDSDLQKLLKTLLSPVVEAENAGGSQSKAVPGASEMENNRPAGRSSDATIHEFSSMDPWDRVHKEQRNVTRTCSVVTTQVAGKGAPTLSDVIVPQAVFDRGPLGSRDDVWDSSTSRDRDNNIASSSSESGRRSPFSRRGFAGNPTSNPFRDKGVPLAMPLEAERKSRYSVSVIDDIILRGKHGMNIGQRIRRSDQEIRLGQITPRYSLSHEHKQSPSGSTPGLQRSIMEFSGEHSRLPAGIRNLIMKEREINSKNHIQTKDDGSPKLSSDEETYSRRERHRKRKTRRERKRASHYSESDSDASSGSERDYYRSHSRKRKRKRAKRRKDENRDRGRRKIPSAALSDVSSSKSSVQYLRTRRNDLQRDDSYSSSLRESNRIDDMTPRSIASRESAHEVYRVAPPAPTNIFVEPHRANVRISSSSIPKLALRIGGDVEDGPSSHKACTEKVTSVSKSFWTSELECDKELSSISSNDLKEQEPAEEKGETQLKKPTRRYRLSTDKALEAAKEPGEITDNSDSSISSEDCF